MNLDVLFSPLVPWPMLAAAAIASIALVTFLIVRRGRGWPLRAAALAILLAALANPIVVREDREPRKDLAVVVVDGSPSQELAGRPATTAALLRSIDKSLQRFKDLEVRTVRVARSADDRGTRLFSQLAQELADEPAERLAGILLVTDGQVHDVPEAGTSLSLAAPVHVLLTGDRDDRDRRLVIDQAAAYGMVGTAVSVVYRIVDHGAGDDRAWPRRPARVSVRVDGEPLATVDAVIGEPESQSIVLRHAGPTVIELEVEAAPGELSTVNNHAVVTVNGVRDRLKVLLVSGQPHAGERTWRNILRSDPAVDLVHFTILRPPEKDDLATIQELSLIAFPVQELFEEKLYDFDLIIFDRYVVRGILPYRYMTRVVDYVKDGGAMLLALGPEFASVASLFHTPMAEIMATAPTGRILEQAYRPLVTDVGRRHPVTSALPGEQAVGDAEEEENKTEPRWGRWFRLIEADVRSGSVLMAGPGLRPLLVVDHVGEGRVAGLLSDQLWLWARGYDGGGPHGELVRRLVHWLMKEPELEEEGLAATIDEGRLVIERRSLSPEAAQVTVVAPSGETERITMEPEDDGIARAERPAPDPGLYRVTDGARTALAASGSLHRLEYADLRTTDEHLGDVAKATGGGIAWAADGPPEFRRVSAGRSTTGDGWMGVRRNDFSVVTGVRRVPLLPALLVLALALAALAAAWWREGR